MAETSCLVHVERKRTWVPEEPGEGYDAGGHAVEEGLLEAEAGRRRPGGTHVVQQHLQALGVHPPLEVDRRAVSCNTTAWCCTRGSRSVQLRVTLYAWVT